MNFIPYFCNFFCTDLLTLNLEEIKDYAYKIKSTNEGVIKSNYGGWQSDSIDLNENDEIKKFLEKMQVVVTYAYNMAKLKTGINLRISNMWFNINSKHDMNYVHTHPKSIFSGVFYVQVPENSGNIVFINPSEVTNYWINAYSETCNEYSSGNYEIQPQENMLIVFPSWLQHYVKPNENDEDRISLSFNIDIQE